MAEDLEPLYTEAQAAEKLGIKPRQLREERVRGFIAYKPVAGRIMYRLRDLIAWQREGICRVDGQTKAHISSRFKSKAGVSQSGTSDGLKTAGASSVQRVLANVERLKHSLRDGSSKEAASPKNR
jgi:hypothetical protein